MNITGDRLERLTSNSQNQKYNLIQKRDNWTNYLNKGVFTNEATDYDSMIEKITRLAALSYDDDNLDSATSNY